MSKPAKKAVAAKKPKATKETKPLTAAQKLDLVGEAVLFEQVADGEYYQDIAQEHGVSRHALMNWLGSHEDIYAGAREARADKLAEDIITIADDTSRDTYIDENGKERTDSEVVARSRLRVDSRKWLASKMLPKKYGDKTTIAGDADNPLSILIMDQIAANPQSRIKVK